MNSTTLQFPSSVPLEDPPQVVKYQHYACFVKYPNTAQNRINRIKQSQYLNFVLFRNVAIILTPCYWYKKKNIYIYIYKNPK